MDGLFTKRIKNTWRASDYLLGGRELQPVANAVPKGCVNQEITSHQLQNLVQNEAFSTLFLPHLDSQISKMPRLQHDLFNKNPPDSRIGHDVVRPDDIYDSGFIDGAPYNEKKQHVTARHITSKKSMNLPAAIEQFTRETEFSPIQTSSITVCSEDNGYNDCVPVDSSANFPVSGLLDSLRTPGGCFQQNKFDWDEEEMASTKCRNFRDTNRSDFQFSLEDNLFVSNMVNPRANNWRTRENSDINMISSTDKLGCVDVSQPQLQTVFYQQLPFDGAAESCVISSKSDLALRNAEDDISRVPVCGNSVLSSGQVLASSNCMNGIGVSTIDSSFDLLGVTNNGWITESVKDTLRTKEYPDDSNILLNDVTGTQSLSFYKTGKRKYLSKREEDYDVTSSIANGENMHPLKCLKMETEFPNDFGASAVPGSSMEPCASDLPWGLEQRPGGLVFNKVNSIEVDEDILRYHCSENAGMIKHDFMDNSQKLNHKDVPNPMEELNVILGRVETENVREAADNIIYNSEDLHKNYLVDCHEEVISARADATQTESEARDNSFVHTAIIDSGNKLRVKKMLGVSLTDFFTAEQVKEHICSCRGLKYQGIGVEAFKTVMMESIDENSCQLCGMNKFVFVPTPIYCSSCGILVKRKLIYYSFLDEVGATHSFCNSCFKMSCGENITFHGISISKAKLEKKKNDKENEESWVQCDKCMGWQHQICALYNDKKDLEGKAEYVCPKCCLLELEIEKSMPFPQVAAFEAKDLPTNMLSDHLEQRLFLHLEQERQQRAMLMGKNPSEVPGAEDLTVRVVLSVNKHLEVNHEFLGLFHGKQYPAAFLYRLKVILLFQKIEGVDVCLFGMYVQEFGSECAYPNQRCVYISYLDSVKYFRPAIEAVSGEPLRTFVYHELLIGYLDYCKKRGFATCYIWACPPLRGEDYILNCHPAAQRTPKSDKLRQWYKLMLRKAYKEDVVVDYTNMYDYLFAHDGRCSTKITAARLPYFDGDYCSGAVVEIIKNIEKECGGGLQKKVKKPKTKRTVKAVRQYTSFDDTRKDIVVMEKLGQAILPAKEDFIVVHLQFSCTLCHEVILSGTRWCCHQCTSFQLCTRCLRVEPSDNDTRTHTTTSGAKHVLSQESVATVPPNTNIEEVTIDNAFFGNRHAFLGFCQSNHYQFDTLRRAKHSSMMILYHLHEPTTFCPENGCSICHMNSSASQGWHCGICPGFDVCDACYQKNGSVCHIHKLTRCTFRSPCGTKKAQPQQQKQLQEKSRLLNDILKHVSECFEAKSNLCPNPNCLRIRKLFFHACQCKIKAQGGCTKCKRIWTMLYFHSKGCEDSSCRIPRCMDIKKHIERRAMRSSAGPYC